MQIPRPGIVGEDLQCSGAELEALAALVRGRIEEQGHVFRPLAERRHVDPQHVESVREFSTEATVLDQLGQGAARRHHEARRRRPLQLLKQRALAFGRQRFKALQDAGPGCVQVEVRWPSGKVSRTEVTPGLLEVEEPR